MTNMSLPPTKALTAPQLFGPGTVAPNNRPKNDGVQRRSKYMVHSNASSSPRRTQANTQRKSANRQHHLRTLTKHGVKSSIVSSDEDRPAAMSPKPRTGVYFENRELDSAIHPLQQGSDSKDPTTHNAPLRFWGSVFPISPSVGRPLSAAPVLPMAGWAQPQPPPFLLRPPPLRHFKRSSSLDLGDHNQKKQHSIDSREESEASSHEQQATKSSITSTTPSGVQEPSMLEAALALANLGGSSREL